MRAFSSFVGGLVVAALIFVAWFFISEKRKGEPPPPGIDAYIAQLTRPHSYQLVHGKVIDAAGQDADIIMRIDTTTGQTWECRVELSKGLYWHALTDDPLTNPAQK